MKEAFIEKRFGAEAERMIGIVNSILAEYAAAGYDLSLRQLYYQLVTKNVVENTERSYKNVGNLVSDARLAGRIDWEIIKDRGREVITNTHWDSPAELLNVYSKYYTIDRWDNQQNYIEVMVEKQALEGVLIPVCRSLDVSFTANKGYSSSTAMYEASKRFLQRAEQGKQLYVLYLGDHDPSGIDMTRDVDDRLELFINTSMGLASNEGGLIEVKRLALNMDQVKTMKPPKNPAKLTDSRATDYIRKFGSSSWELDAIEPKTLARLVTQAVQSLIDDEAWEETEKKQQAGRDYIVKMAKNYKPK